MPLLLVAAAYARVLPGEFVLDDARAIEQSLAVKDLGGFLGRPFLESFLHGGRPVADVALGAAYAVGRLDPRPYHALAIAIHLAAVVLAFLVARAVVRLAGGARPGAVALVAAGLFAIHPLQTQAVSYVVQLAETLSSALFLATVLSLLAADRRGSTPRRLALLAGGLVVFVLALGAKAVAATAPLAYLLVVTLAPGPAGRADGVSWRSRIAGIVPFIAVDIWFATRTVAGLAGHADAGFSVPGLPPWTYLLTQWRVVATYLRLAAWPVGQNVDWSFAPSPSLADPSTLAAGALLAALLGLAVVASLRARRTDGDGAASTRVAGTGVAWFFLLLAPTSTVIPLADLVMEHRPYLALLGLFLAVSAGGERAFAALSVRIGARRAGIAAAVVVGLAWAALAAATRHRNEVWETRLAFWTDVVSKSPGKARARFGHGFALEDRGRHDEAIAEYLVALDLVGGNAPLRGQVLRNLVAALIRSGRLAEADGVVARALAEDPANADLLVDAAILAQRRGDVASMEDWSRRALAVNPDSGDALGLLGMALVARGDVGGALPLLERSARLDADDGVKLVNLGLGLDRAGRRDEACAAWRRALGLRLDPGLRQRVEQRIAAAGCGG